MKLTNSQLGYILAMLADVFRLDHDPHSTTRKSDVQIEALFNQYAGNWLRQNCIPMIYVLRLYRAIDAEAIKE